MTIWLPPLRGPEAGLSEVIVGAATNVNWSNEPVTSVPPAEVTVTSTTPGVVAGVVAAIDVSPAMVNAAAGTPPNETAVAPLKPVPVIVTVVPPAAGPAATEMPVTRGTGTYEGANSR